MLAVPRRSRSGLVVTPGWKTRTRAACSSLPRTRAHGALAKQLGMEIPARRGAETELRSRADAIDAIRSRRSDRATLSDPIENEVRAALTRSEMRTKRATGGAPAQREEPDAP